MFKQSVCVRVSVSRKLLKMGRAINYGHRLAAAQNDRPLLVFLPPFFSRSLSFSLSLFICHMSASLSWVLSLILPPFYSTAARLMKQDLADLQREREREKVPCLSLYCRCEMMGTFSVPGCNLLGGEKKGTTSVSSRVLCSE